MPASYLVISPSFSLSLSFVGNLTPFAKQAIKEMSSHGYRMEYFRDAELLVDITEHKLVPGRSHFNESTAFSLVHCLLYCFILIITIGSALFYFMSRTAIHEVISQSVVMKCGTMLFIFSYLLFYCRHHFTEVLAFSHGYDS